MSGFLHVTVVPWFRMNTSSLQLVHDLTGRLDGISPFEVNVGNAGRLGVNDGVMVNFVRQPTPLTEIRNRIEQFLHDQGVWTVSSRHERYVPHITVQAEERSQAGDAFWYDRLCVVSQRAGYKQIKAKN